MTEASPKPACVTRTVVDGVEMVSFAFVRVENGRPDVEAHAFRVADLEAVLAAVQAQRNADDGKNRRVA